MGRIRKGIIKGFNGSWGSGLGTLVIEDEVEGTVAVPCDNGPTVRALQQAFGDTVGDGHTVKPQGAYVDQEVYWMYDDMGLTLEVFVPVGEASEELLVAYEAGE